MSPEVSERAFEDAIECGLLQSGPDACAGDAPVVHEPPASYGTPGGYRRRSPQDSDRALCLLPRDALDFVLATQPKEWTKLAQHHGAAVQEQFLKRLAAEIERRGTLDVLRNGIKDSACKFRLAYFRPASGLNEETRRLHAANLFAEVRQMLHQLGKNASLTLGNKKSVDIVIFRDGAYPLTIDVKGVADRLDWLLGNASMTGRSNHFIVLVSFEGTIADPRTIPRIWVFPHKELLPFIKTAANGKTRYAPRKAIIANGGAYENTWRLLDR